MPTMATHRPPANPSVQQVLSDWLALLRRALRPGQLALILAALATGCGERNDHARKLQAAQAGIGKLRHAPGLTPFVASLGSNLRNYQDLANLAWSSSRAPARIRSRWRSPTTSPGSTGARRGSPAACAW